jgi:hypothetical protein
MFFFLSSPPVNRATTASAIFRFFIFVLLAIVGPIVIWHWWDASAHNGDLAFTLVAAKNTHTLFVRENATASECPPEEDCTPTTTVQTFTGTLHAYYDTSITIGSSAARCVAIGDLGDSGFGIYQKCVTVYTFNGDGNITAGTIAAQTIVLSFPDEEGEYMQTPAAIVGGTGPYKAASGGVVSRTTNPVATEFRDLTFADVVMVSA